MCCVPQTELLDSFRLLDPQTCSGLLKPHQGPLLFGDMLREATLRTSEEVPSEKETAKAFGILSNPDFSSLGL